MSCCGIGLHNLYLHSGSSALGRYPCVFDEHREEGWG